MIQDGTAKFAAIAIETYAGKTDSRSPSVVRSHHAIIYTRNAPDSPNTLSSPIRVSPLATGTRLDPKSRLDFGNSYRYSPASKSVIEPRITCLLGGQKASSLPDTGAKVNFLPLAYVKARKLVVDATKAQVFNTAIGRPMTSVGTVPLSLEFDRETRRYPLEWHVVPDTPMGLPVLGGPFLRLTKTFREYKHRVSQKLLYSFPHRLWSSGSSHQLISGFVNGVPINALPDTGSNIMAMSAAYAKTRSFYVDRARQYRILVRFPDGYTTRTRGVVKNAKLQFGSRPEDIYYKDVYVLDDLEHDLVLDYMFLYETDALDLYEDSLSEYDTDDADEDMSFCAIQRDDPRSEGTQQV